MAKSGVRKGHATYVQYGYGQVEPNHLSAPQNGQVYAQLPAAANIDMLENGQFVKYDYAQGVCDFSKDPSAGAWMMVFNEVKVYHDFETDADFAMLKDNYAASVYSPIGQNTSNLRAVVNRLGTRYGTNSVYNKMYESFEYPAMMPAGTTMVPRVLRISVGDIYTTNTIMATPGTLKKGDLLTIGDDGYLKVDTGASEKGGDLDPVFAVVKVYTMPDMQPGVKVQRVK